MNDEEFLANASCYVSDGEIDAAHAMLTDPELTLGTVCADTGSSQTVVMGLQGKLKEVVIRNGKVAPGLRYVDPWVEPAVIDSKNKRQLAAFAIYRTVERPSGTPQLVERGSSVN